MNEETVISFKVGINLFSSDVRDETRAEGSRPDQTDQTDPLGGSTKLNEVVARRKEATNTDVRLKVRACESSALGERDSRLLSHKEKAQS